MLRRAEPWAAVSALLIVLVLATAGKFLEVAGTDTAAIPDTVEPVVEPTIIPQEQATISPIDPYRERLAEYGGVRPPLPESAVPLNIELSTESGFPTTYVFSYDLPADGPWDVEIRSFYGGPVGIVAHTGNNAFHNWNTNTNVVLWIMNQDSGQHSVTLGVHDFFAPESAAPVLLWIDAFYKRP